MNEKIVGGYTTIAQSALLNGEPVRAQSGPSQEIDLGMKFAVMSFGLQDRFANHPAELFPTPRPHRTRRPRKHRRRPLHVDQNPCAAPQKASAP